jgi:ABC-type glycerol-3-phosphate transport system substrate-binding protein
MSRRRLLGLGAGAGMSLWLNRSKVLAAATPAASPAVVPIAAAGQLEAQTIRIFYQSGPEVDAHTRLSPQFTEYTKGKVKVENGNLRFAHGKAKTELAVSTIEDVVTGNDSQRAVHGFVGTLTMFAPYGGGRFLSLFRTKLDTLTLQYRDADGGLHGVIFTMDVGKADPLKKLLVAQGAHTSLPTPDAPAASDASRDATKEHKP